MSACDWCKSSDQEPDDTGYKPTVGDPLLRGAARVDGVTAKVVRRRHTITQFQYDRETKDTT
jgi:hypothetical protein